MKTNVSQKGKKAVKVEIAYLAFWLLKMEKNDYSFALVK